MMRIYLVRHGKASKDPVYTNDADRPLTGRGQKDITRIAAQMAQAGIEVYQVRHSGLLRARQTAEIFGQHLKPAGGVIRVAGLLFDDPVNQLAEELRLETQPVLLAGHNPFMERLTSQLLTGSPDHTPVRFSTSCTVCLDYVPEEGGWAVRWVLNPEIMPGK